MPQDTDVQAFATSFAQLANSILVQKIPSIVDKLLGFQVLERNEESSRAVGFFAFDLNGQLCYTPAFFLRGEIKGLDLLYYKDGDIFVPLNESWVNYIETKKPVSAGEGTSASPLDLNITAPDLSTTSAFKFNSKVAGYMPTWAVDGVKMFSLRDPMTDTRYAKVATLVDGLKACSPEVGYKFISHISKHRKLAQFIKDNYDEKDLVKAVRYSKSKTACLNPVATVHKAEFITLKSEKVASLTDVEKEKVLRGDIITKEPRDVTKLAKVLETKPDLYSSVKEPGYLNVLFKDGSFDDALVLQTTSVGAGRTTSPRYIVYRDGADRVAEAEGSNIVVNTAETTPLNKSEFADKIKKAGTSLNSLKKNDFVLFVDTYGNSTVPVRILGSVSSEYGTVLTVTEETWETVVCHDKPINHIDTFRNSQYSRGPTGVVRAPYYENKTFVSEEDKRGYQLKVLISDKPVDGLVNVGGKLVVNPDTTVAIKLNREYKPSDVPMPAIEAQDDQAEQAREYGVGTFADIESCLAKTASYDKIKLYHSNGTFEILGNKVREVGISKLAALDVLANKLTIHADKAVELIKSAQENTTCRFHLIKTAAGIATPFFDPNTGVQSIAPTTEANVLESPVAGPQEKTPDINFGSFEDKVNTMNQAVSSGEKDIFDAAALGALIDINDPSEEINRYISDLILSLDRIGRILFMMYWHYDSFVERYDKQDLVNLEDSLINVFKNLGELTYDLQQRAIVTDDTIKGVGLA